MDYIAEKGDTFKSIAAQFTIGGEDYAIAIERQNYNVQKQYNAADGEVIPGAVYIIPESWLKPVWKGVDQYGNKKTGPLTIEIKGHGGQKQFIDLTVPSILGAIALFIWAARKK